MPYLTNYEHMFIGSYILIGLRVLLQFQAKGKLGLLELFPA